MKMYITLLTAAVHLMAQSTTNEITQRYVCREVITTNIIIKTNGEQETRQLTNKQPTIITSTKISDGPKTYTLEYTDQGSYSPDLSKTNLKFNYKQNVLSSISISNQKNEIIYLLTGCRALHYRNGMEIPTEYNN
jgi:hypothetical protein